MQQIIIPAVLGAVFAFTVVGLYVTLRLLRSSYRDWTGR